MGCASDRVRIALHAAYGTLRRENAYQCDRNPDFLNRFGRQLSKNHGRMNLNRAVLSRLTSLAVNPFT